MRFFFPIVLIAIGICVSSSLYAAKPVKYIVRSGDSIAKIAQFYGVEQDALRDTNDLGKDAIIKPGDLLVINDELIGGWTISHKVRKGDTLVRISKRYRVDLQELSSVNRVGTDDLLEVGRRLVIPKGERLVDVESDIDEEKENAQKTGVEKEKPWNGKATFVRPRDNERKALTIFDKKGRVRTFALRSISYLGRSKKGRVKKLHVRLIKLLGKTAEHFPGRTIEIISGYRPHSRGQRPSQHAKGRAVDFRVRGVANLELYNFLKTLPKVGVGYYPNSVFVHFDVRDRKYLWTDLSGPGESARYVREGDLGEPTSSQVPKSDQQPDPENFTEDDLPQVSQ